MSRRDAGRDVFDVPVNQPKASNVSGGKTTCDVDGGSGTALPTVDAECGCGTIACALGVASNIAGGV